MGNAIFLFDSNNIDKYISSKSFLSTLLVQNKIETLAEFKGWLKGISISLFEHNMLFPEKEKKNNFDKFGFINWNRVQT